METKISLTCFSCGKTFERRAAEHKRVQNPDRVYCSRRCCHTETASVTKPCFVCGKLTSRKPSEMLPHGKYFCSRSCAGTHSNAHKTKGSCRSKLEIFLEEKLKEKYPSLEIVCNRTDAIQAELDIYFPSLRFAVELNGIFHYEPIFGVEKLQATQNNDKRKFQACIEKGIELMIIDTHHFRYFKSEAAGRFLKMITDILDTKL